MLTQDTPSATSSSQFQIHFGLHCIQQDNPTHQKGLDPISPQPCSPWLGGKVGDDVLRGRKARPPLAAHSTNISRILPQVISKRAALTRQEYRLKGHQRNRGQPYSTSWRSDRVKGAASTFSWAMHHHWRTISHISPNQREISTPGQAGETRAFQQPSQKNTESSTTATNPQRGSAGDF